MKILKSITTLENRLFHSTPNETHLFCASLIRPPASVRLFKSFLVEEELNRAERFCFPKDQDSYIVGRGLLRFLLSKYIGLPPMDVQFVYNEFGKPAVSVDIECGVKFNLSHSGGLIVYGITSDNEVGIDIEKIRSNLDWERIANRFFSVRENETLQTLTPADRKTAFFNCWTRKEAYIKARGQGLSLNLDCFDVTVAPGMAAQLIDSREDPEEVGRWIFKDVAPNLDYAATLVIREPAGEIRYLA